MDSTNHAIVGFGENVGTLKFGVDFDNERVPECVQSVEVQGIGLLVGFRRFWSRSRI
jgi:hypothetical protein